MMCKKCIHKHWGAFCGRVFLWDYSVGEFTKWEVDEGELPAGEFDKGGGGILRGRIFQWGVLLLLLFKGTQKLERSFPWTLHYRIYL